MDLYELMTFVHIAAAVGLLSGSVVASPGVRVTWTPRITPAPVIIAGR